MLPFGVKLGAVFPQPMSEVYIKFGGAKPHGTVLEDCVGWRKPNLVEFLVPTGNNS